MSAPLAYLITWTTYGSWLPGDRRGWVEAGQEGIQPPDPRRQQESRTALAEPAVVLDAEQRQLVEQTIRDHCSYRGWALHAVNARSDHVHIVLTAAVAPEVAMNQLKAWCSRRLNELQARRGAPAHDRWWTVHGSTKWINAEGYLQNAIRYVKERQ